MNDINEILARVKAQLADVEDKIKGKFDGVDESFANELQKGLREGLKECQEQLNKFKYHFKTNDSTGSTEENGDKEPSKKDPFAEKIERIAPYLSEETLHEAVEQFVNGELDLDINSILVYLSDDSISLLMKKLTECGGKFNGLDIEDILVYADSEDVNAAFMAKAREGVIDTAMMPYIDDDCWHELVVEYCKNEDSKLNIDAAYPYLDDEDVALLFKTYLKRRKKKD